MRAQYEREFRQPASRGQPRQRQNINTDDEQPWQHTPATDEQSVPGRLFSLLTRMSGDVMTGAVVGVVVATPCLRKLFLRIVLGAALVGAVLTALLFCWLASIARAS